MIVVIGSLRLRGSGDDADVAGLVASVASAAAADGALVEVIARLGDDPAGDAVLLAFARRHVGHVAVLRDPARPTVVIAETQDDRDPGASDGPDRASPEDGPRLDAADTDLALRYLPEISVIVAVHVDDDVIAEAIHATAWADTSLIVVVPPGAPVPQGLPPAAVTLEVADDDESAAGSPIGRYAAALDQGEAARDAYEALIAAVSA